MRFTEAMLRAHREEDPGQPASPDGRRCGLPDVRYTYDFEAFSEDWTDRSGATIDDMRRSMTIIVVLAFVERLPDIRFDRRWWALRHQGGGHNSDQLSMIATRLRPRSAVAGPLLEIARDRLNADGGWFGRGQASPSQVASYRAALTAIGLDCAATWRLLHESVYPIDATQQNLDRIASDAPDLDRLADWQGRGPDRHPADPVILVLTEDWE